jgi:hypothetical protein
MQNTHFWTAFGAAQINFRSPKKSGINAFANNHAYHKLEDLLPAVISALNEESIIFRFADINKADEAGTRIIMTHLPSGQSHEQECFVDKKERSAQATGGCYTYAKRYLLASLFLISDPKLDDDGDFATHGNRKKPAAKPKLATDEVVAKIRAKLSDHNIPEEAALSKVGAKNWVITNDQATIIQGRIDQLEAIQ